MTTDRYRLGIDFGTSSTVAVLAGPDGRTRSLLFDASPLLASAVFAGPADELLTGADAERAAVAHPAGFEGNPKRRIDDAVVWLGECEHSVVDLIAAVLGRVAAEACRVTGNPPGHPPGSVVLTHPAGWGRPRLGILTDAAARAGLHSVGFVAEPVAAAAYFTTVLGRDVPVGRCLLVYDLGAGTFDVAVIRRTPTDFEVIATAGLTDVGGLDLDAAVVDHARALTADATTAWGRLDWPQTANDHQASHALWLNARAAKEQLSRHTTADLHVPLAGTDLHLTRDEFEKAARLHLDRTVALTLATVRDARTPRDTIAGVLLVGGSTRIPLVATLLHRALRLAPTVIDHPELVVAEGSLHTRATPAVAPTIPRIAVPRIAVPRIAVARTASGSASEPGGSASEPGGSASANSLDPVRASGANADVSTGRRPSTTAGVLGEAPDGVVSDRSSSRLRGRRSTILTAVAVAVAMVLSIATAIWLTNRPDLGQGPGPSSSPHQIDPHQIDATLAGHTGAVRSVAFSPDGKTLATGSDDNTARLWNVATGKLNATLTGHTGAVRTVVFSTDGVTIATDGKPGTVQVWNVATGTTLRTVALAHPSTYLATMAFSTDGATLATADASGDGMVRLWDAATGRPMRTLTDPGTNSSGSMAFNPKDGNILATAPVNDDMKVRLWNVSTGQIVRTLTGHTRPVRSVAFSPDGRTLATASDDMTARLWNIAD